MAVMKASEFVAKLKDVAQNYKNPLCHGVLWCASDGGNVSRYCNNHAYNKQAARTKMIKPPQTRTRLFSGSIAYA